MKSFTKYISTMMVGALLAVSLPLSAGATAIPAKAAGAKTVTAYGNATTQVKPDTAYITLGFRTKGKDVIKATNASSQKMKKITAAVIKAGVKKDDVQTSGLSVYESYDYEMPYTMDMEKEKPGSKIEEPKPSYQIENSVNITLRDIDKLSEVVNSAFKAGANYINNVSFDVAEQGDSYDEMLAKATKAGVRRAKMLAEASSQEIDEVIDITEMSSNSMMDYKYMYSGGGGYYSVDLSSIQNSKEQANAAVELGNDLRTGTIAIMAQVSVTYSVK